MTEEYETDYSLSVVGDTIVEGLECKKMKKVTDAAGEAYINDTTFVFYENNVGQVFIVEGKYLTCVMDFDYLEGEWVFDMIDEFPAFSMKPFLKEIDKVSVNGVERKRYKFDCKYIVEGIGCSRYIFWAENNDWDESQTEVTLESVYENGECIFTKEDFMAPPSANESVTAETVRPADDTIYDLMGRRVVKPQPGTIYIRNGQKFILR